MKHISCFEVVALSTWPGMRESGSELSAIFNEFTINLRSVVSVSFGYMKLPQTSSDKS